MTTSNRLRTECCGVPIADDWRFCPKCGYEARVEVAPARVPAAPLPIDSPHRSEATPATREVNAAPPRGAEPDLPLQAASLFIRDVIEALGESQPPLDACVDLPALALRVVGQIEDYKVRAEQTEAALALAQREREEAVAFAVTELRRSLKAALAAGDASED